MYLIRLSKLNCDDDINSNNNINNYYYFNVELLYNILLLYFHYYQLLLLLLLTALEWYLLWKMLYKYIITDLNWKFSLGLYI